jgi:multisubunit Na+/H+ antiporter MnhG subunit
VSAGHVISSILLVAGVGLEVLAVLGLVVMRAVLDRLHYVGLAGAGGLLVGVSILVRESFSLIGDKALLTGFVLFVLGGVLVHVTARSLQIRRHGTWNARIEEIAEEEQAG